ncbi:MAG: mannosyltransferase family protein, partial [Candidatus Promineifilaceae bacterium]
MKKLTPKRTIFLIWLGWVVIILGYQAFVLARFKVQRPDNALFWTAGSTRVGGAQDQKYYLQEDYLKAQTAWDSEYYLAIAIGGYEDPNVDRVGDTVVSSGTPTYWPFVAQGVSTTIRPGLSLSYAFFPFYPFMIRLFSFPLSILGMNPIATATLAAVIVSLLGTLAAMLSLYDLAESELGEAGGIRAAFYLIIFPSGFFLAQVYTEGLFVGLAFTSLALLRKGHYRWAALLAVFATFTRAAGIVLVIPLLLNWIQEGEWLDLDLEWRQIYFKGLPWRAIAHALIVFAPAIAFFLWKSTYLGRAFTQVEQDFFGRGFLNLNATYS